MSLVHILVSCFLKIPGSVLQYTSSFPLLKFSEQNFLCRFSHSGGYAECYLPAYNAVKLFDSRPTFRRTMSQASDKQSSTCYLLHARIRFRPSKWRRHILVKRRLTFEERHGVTPKIELFTICVYPAFY
jgi:hypothetical protein